MIATLAELDHVRRDCRKMVTTRALVAAGATVVPVPGLDIATDIGLLTTLLPAISKRFELDHDTVAKLDAHVAERILVMASGMGNSMIGRAVTKRVVAGVLRRVGARIATASAARYVPLAGSAIAATISFGAMKAVGNAHIEDCYRTAKAMIAAPTG